MTPTTNSRALSMIVATAMIGVASFAGPSSAFEHLDRSALALAQKVDRQPVQADTGLDVSARPAPALAQTSSRPGGLHAFSDGERAARNGRPELALAQGGPFDG